MTSLKNSLGQPIGEAVPDWQPSPPPPRQPKDGRFCRIEPVDIDRHAPDLFAAFATDTDNRNWTYLPYGPFAREADLRVWMEQTCLGDDPLFHAVIDKKTGKAVGVASYLRITPAVGVIEVGHINYSPLLQRTAAATEASFLMMARVFSELGYRRYEWKCDALNGPSRTAAERLGFCFEGVFRQATMYKGRNRDTAWYSILDKDWPALEKAYSKWLDADNFDDQGRQKASLGNFVKDGRQA
jgi:RimJ/RimL family protein N-acetyltransferase